ncbi:MYG1 exonuclease-like isoform X2 [Xenia sp. Carnegie-2017]|nr:MYG1 exonuclease-like isoform X2 [Xenia sp. Carnegie-2017]
MATEPLTKKLNCHKIIGTHNGTFHCDEVLACSMLKLLPIYSNAKIVRTRDENILKSCDIVVDVGGTYDPSLNRFDHHQRSFSGTMSSLGGLKYDIKLSSAGLIYLHYGKDIIAQVMKLVEDDDMVELVYTKVYESFIQEIDAIDNGINQYDGEPRYSISTNISARVSSLNPKWNEKNPDSEAGFFKAMKMVENEFIETVTYFKDVWLPARTIVEKAIVKRHELDASGEVIYIDEGCPWKDHLFDLENKHNICVPIKFAIFTDQNGKWRVQCVPIATKSFENRLSLLEEWRGLRDEELCRVSGIPECIFVHASGFIGGNETKEGALEMARATLRQSPP